MRLRVSIFLLICLGGTDALADALSPCPTPQFSYTCQGGVPALFVTRASRGETLDLKLAGAQAGGALGDTLMSLPSGAMTFSQPLDKVPTSAQKIAIVGSDAQGACCFNSALVPAPPADLCIPAEDAGDTAVKPKGTGTLTEGPTPFDIALSLDLEPLCTEGPAQHSCSGILTFTVTGTPTGIVPLTLEIEPNKGIDLALSGPLSCYNAGSGVNFCRAPADILAHGMTLPLQVSADTSFRKRTAQLCASLAQPSDPRAQIKLVQTALQALDYDPGSLDGKNGPSTRKAVKALGAQLGLDVEDPLDPALLALLGLAPFEDGVLDNNSVCAETVLPPRPRPETIDKPRITPAPLPKEDDVILYDPPALICDPLSTVARGDTCACRYEGMIRFNASTCVCENGLPPLPGAQCR